MDCKHYGSHGLCKKFKSECVLEWDFNLGGCADREPKPRNTQRPSTCKYCVPTEYGCGWCQVGRLVTQLWDAYRDCRCPLGKDGVE